MAKTTIIASAAGPTAGVALTEENSVVKIQSADWAQSRVSIEASDTDGAYVPVYDQAGPNNLGPVVGRSEGVFKLDLPNGWYVRVNVLKYGGSQINVVFQ